VDRLPKGCVEAADLIGIHLPMHTATRLAVPVIECIRRINPDVHLCAFGLYAPLNAEYLRELGVRTVVGGEFEGALVEIAAGVAQEKTVRLDRLDFPTPDRPGMKLDRHAAVQEGLARRLAGYTEASRGCKHLCRHCPVVPVYQGTFRIVPVETVLADIEQQVAMGATHVTFGDPDFLNGPGHARRIVEALHNRFPSLTYDVTIKVEHLVDHSDLLGLLKTTGCLWITSAVESFDDRVLALLNKGHTRHDFIEALRLCRDNGLNLSPTFIPFSPWTTIESYRDLLETLVELDLVEQTAPIQLALRLLIPSGSPLLELQDVRAVTSGFDMVSLTHRWRHPDAKLDELSRDLLDLVAQSQKSGDSRPQTFARICERSLGQPLDPLLTARAAIPYLTEPWYC